MARKYRRQGTATYVNAASDRVDPAEAEQRLAEREQREASDTPHRSATLAQRSAGRSQRAGCEALGRVLIKMGLVSNGDRCPLWVKSGHVQRTCPCPLSAKSGHGPTYSITSSARESSFSGIWRFRGFKVDNQLELGGLQAGHVGFGEDIRLPDLREQIANCPLAG
jgi:hypothetical protein